MSISLDEVCGTLSLASNDPIHPITTLTFGAEGVPVGIRLIVLQSDGTPYSEVDDITLKNKHEKPKIDIKVKDNRLVTIDPPTAWTRIRYHFQTALPPTDDADDYYEVKVKVGKKSQTLTFTLGSFEFNQIVITLP